MIPNSQCRSFLSPYKENGEYKFYGRFNKGVVTILEKQNHKVQNFFRKLKFKIPEYKKIDFDEYASFKSWLSTQPKEKQNKANATINLLILEGRQLGCHLILAMQKSDATILPTHLRENMLFSLVLANSGEQTYITAFGNEIASIIPERDREKGEGIYITDSSNVARTLRTPFLNFDIWQGYKILAQKLKKQEK